MSIPNPVDFMNLAQEFVSQIKDAFGQVKSAVSFLQVIGMVVIIGKCAFSAFWFVIQFCVWLFKDFIMWLVSYPVGTVPLVPKRGEENIRAGFIWWLIRYIVVMIMKIVRLPKCFLWYFLDTAGWALYLPFRVTFWVMDLVMGGTQIQTAEHKAWDVLDQIDYYLHGRPKDNYFMFQYDPNPAPRLDENGYDADTMKMGLHIIHFPDSVMNECYSVSPYKLARLAPFPMDEFIAFMKCAMNPF